MLFDDATFYFTEFLLTCFSMHYKFIEYLFPFFPRNNIGSAMIWLSSSLSRLKKSREVHRKVKIFCSVLVFDLLPLLGPDSPLSCSVASIYFFGSTNGAIKVRSVQCCEAKGNFQTFK